MSESLRQVVQRGVGGGALGIALVGLRFVVGFVTQLILIRLLLPEQFGQFAQVLIAVGFIGLVRTFHTGEYLISRPEEDVTRAYDALFTFELLQGAVVAGLGLLLAGPMVRLIGGAGLEQAVWAMLASFIILPFGFAGSLMNRQLAFLRSHLPALVGTLVGPVAKIGLALAGWGMWSLLVGELLRMLLEVVLLWCLAPRRPRLAFDGRLVRQAARFGAPITLAAGIAYYYWQFDDVVVGRLLGSAALGYYFVAFRIPRYLYQLREQLAVVTYPVLVRLDRHGQLGRGLETLIRYAGYLAGLPLLVVLLYGGELIEVLFGARWLPALVPLKILMGATALRVVAGLTGDVFKARGRTSVFLLFNTMNALMLTALVIPLTRRHGISGTAAAVLLTLLPSSLLALVLVKRLVPVRLLPALWRPALATVGVLLAGWWLPRPPASLPGLLLVLGGASLAFGLLVLLLDRGMVGELRWLIGSDPSEGSRDAG